MREAILFEYHKILNCITSCKEEPQLKACENMVENFDDKYRLHSSQELLSKDLYNEISLLQSSLSTTTTLPV